MGAKKVKSLTCYQCRRVVDNETVIHETIGNIKIKDIWLHPGECHEKFLQRRQDTEDLDYLYRYIKDIYGKRQDDILPKGFITKLQDIRNGAVRYVKGGIVDPKSLEKEGVPFDVLIEAYQLSEKTIKYTMNTKPFTSDIQMFSYGLAIVKNKVNAVQARRRLLEQRKASAEQRKNNQTSEPNAYTATEADMSIYEKIQKRDDDISDLIDD
jgi:hypothetical protein